MKKSLISVTTVLIMASLACSLNVNVPRIDTGETETLQINENYPDGNEPGDITIEMGGGQLSVQGGAENWLSGNVSYNVPLWNPEVIRRSNSIKVTQETKDKIGLPDEKIINKWDLFIGDHPTNLLITAGAYQGKLDLTGIPLTNLEIRDGASQAEIVFNDYNPVQMNDLVYKTGASQITLEGLGYANIDELSFEGGAGSYTLNFDGVLQQETRAFVNYGLGDAKIEIPPNTAARIVVEGGLNNVELQGSWNVDGNEYTNNGSGPLLDITVKMGVGNLQLISK
jgi:hypothetical protein